jgi:hypothetical protein
MATVWESCDAYFMRVMRGEWSLVVQQDGEVRC